MALLIRLVLPSLRAWVHGLAVVMVLLFALPASAQSGAPGEYELKAAFIYRIAGFVEWPGMTGAATATATATAPLRLCLLGGNPFGTELEKLRGRKVGDRPFAVRQIDPADSLHDCHLLFVSAAADKHVERVVALTREAGILTLGDTEGYARRGLMLNFYPERDRVRFEANREAVRRGGLKISAKLLTLARLAESQPAD